MSEEPTRSERQREAFRALANRSRYRILYTLASDREAHSCQEFIADLHVSAPAISNHLQVLKDAGLVKTVRRGVQVYVALAPTETAYQMAAMIQSASASQLGDEL